MTEKNTAWRRRVVAALGVIAIGAAGFAGSTAANAANFGNIDGDAEGSIIVHKHENQTGTPIVGDPESATTLPNPIAGAGFTPYFIEGIDLTTPEGWTLVQGAVVSGCDVSHPTNTAVSLGAAARDEVLSGADGVANLTDLMVGAYLVCETTTPANVAVAAQPFIVTIPFPDNQTGAPSNSNGWIYDVHVYPKNTLRTQVTKSIAAQGEFGLGSKVTFPVTATVPRIPAENVFTEFAIVDDMDSRFRDVKVESVTVDGAAVNAAFYSKTADGIDPAKVWFNADGLAWLKSQGGKSVVVTFSGVVQSLGNGSIQNVAQYFISHAPGTTPPDPEEPEPCVEDCDTTPPVTTNWGELKVRKVDGANTNTGLGGATFEVYASTDPYSTNCATTGRGATPISVQTSTPPAPPVYQTEFTSDGNGNISIPGLFVSDSVNPTPNAPARCYWLKETVAPAGFVTPDPDTDAAWFAVSVTTGASATVDISVPNDRETVPPLPLTGAAGQALMVAGGIALLALGTTLYLVRRRQSTKV